MITSRVLATLAAASLVAAFALATLLPPQTTLAQLIALFDPRLLYAVHEWAMAHGAGWTWAHVLRPVLMRPSWLLPTSFGLVFAGGAMTFGSSKRVPRSHRRRS